MDVLLECDGTSIFRSNSRSNVIFWICIVHIAGMRRKASEYHSQPFHNAVGTEDQKIQTLSWNDNFVLKYNYTINYFV
jgi:hypothetical protein